MYTKFKIQFPQRWKILSFIGQSAKLFILLILLLSCELIYSQENEGFNTWFFYQRSYPHDTIQQDVYATATELQSMNTASVGYYLATPWRSMGPTILGSGAGRVASVKYVPDYHPTNKPFIYIAAHTGGVWKSINGGNSFYPITEDLPTQSSGDICIDPNNTEIIYYATGGNVENFMYNYYGLGVFKSTDGGNTWSGGNNVNNRKLTYSYKIVVNPNANYSSWVYLAERNGLFVSTNAGVTWNSGYVGYGSCQGVETSIDGSKVYAVGGFNGIDWPPGLQGIGYWMSTNYGANFTQMTGTGFNPGDRTQISVCKESGYDNYIYAVTNTGGNVVAYMSTDGGYTFPVNKTVGPSSGSMASDFLFIQTSPHNHLVAFVGYGNGWKGSCLYKTTDGGNTFPGVYNSYTADNNDLDFNPNPNYPDEVILGADQGLFLSPNLGGSWQDLGNTLAISESFRVTSYYDAYVDLVMTGVEDGGLV